MAHHPVIKKGSKGAAVTTAQNNLKARYYDPGPVDGVFGPKTFNQVKWYQSDRGLTADGVVGTKTWFRLDPPTVKKGSKGGTVSMLQRILDDYGYNPGDDDRDFGTKTEKAVKQFQTDFSLVVDGVVGPQTWAMLWS